MPGPSCLGHLDLQELLVARSFCPQFCVSCGRWSSWSLRPWWTLSRDLDGQPVAGSWESGAPGGSEVRFNCPQLASASYMMQRMQVHQGPGYNIMPRLTLYPKLRNCKAPIMPQSITVASKRRQVILINYFQKSIMQLLS